MNIAYDYDGTISAGIIPDKNGVIITGRYQKEEPELRAFLKKIDRDIPIYFLPDDIEHTVENIINFKSSMLEELNIDRYYEDRNEIVDVLKEKNPNIQIIDIDPDMHFVTITKGWDGMPIAYNLSKGMDSLIAQIQNVDELKNGDDKEDGEDKKERLSQYNGMMKKYPARKVVDALKKVNNKDDYFIFCDQNNLWAYAEELLNAGFTKGLFPTKDDYEFEKGREEAMEFVEKHYPDVKIIPHQKIATVEEAKKLVEESDVPLVIQSEGDFVSTICPVDDVELNHTEILAALDKHAKDYAKGQIILKEKLVQPIEITPQIIFWNGQPVFTDLDIETKNIGDGENNGNQVGCGSNLIIKTNLEDEINRIAFPPIVYEMAAKRKGIFVWDISLYLTEQGIFFGEFCSNRFGYDALMTEMTMSGGALAFFSAIMSLQNPLQSTFGTAVRVFNLNRSKDQNITVGKNAYTWLYEVKKDKEELTSVGDCWDLGVMTGRGDTVNEAVEHVYKNLETLSFKEKYTRTKADFLMDYPTSIIHRFIMTNGVMFDAPELEDTKKENTTYDEKLKLASNQMQMKFDTDLKSKDSKYKDEIKSIREEIKTIINA